MTAFRSYFRLHFRFCLNAASHLSLKLTFVKTRWLDFLMAISYIVGQLNSPIGQLIDFIKEVQDAKISLERLSEIHNKEDEEQQDAQKITEIPLNAKIELSKVTFSYIGYKTITKQITLDQDLKFDLELELASTQLREVEITAERKDENN